MSEFASTSRVGTPHGEVGGTGRRASDGEPDWRAPPPRRCRRWGEGPAGSPEVGPGEPEPGIEEAGVVEEGTGLDHSPVPPGDEELPPDGQPEDEEPIRVPRLGISPGRPRGSRTRQLPVVDPAAAKMAPEQRLLVLDTWLRSGLPAGGFGELVGVSKHTLYAWKKRFEEMGPGGLIGQVKGKTGSKLPELTKRSILMLKQAHPEYGCQRISDMLARGPRSAGQRRGRRPRPAGSRIRHRGTAHQAASRSRAQLRAGHAQSALADRPVYLHAQAAEPPGVPGGVHG